MALAPPIFPTRSPGALPLRLLGDDQLARLASRGSAQAVAVIYDRHHAALLRYCRSILLDAEDARDAMHDAMVKAIRALTERHVEVSLRPWLFRIAHNESISLLRRRRPQVELTDAVTPAVEDVAQTAADRERLSQLVCDLAGLPERQRGALVMRELCGLSYDEIAIALAATPAASRQVVFEARSALQHMADGRSLDCDGIRRRLSDGDRRALRGRRMRAHLRACDDCRSFADALGSRARDLGLLAPALSGAALFGLFGGGGSAALTGLGSSAGAAGALAASPAMKAVAVGAATLAVASYGAAERGALGLGRDSDAPIAQRDAQEPAPQVDAADRGSVLQAPSRPERSVTSERAAPRRNAPDPLVIAEAAPRRNAPTAPSRPQPDDVTRVEVTQAPEPDVAAVDVTPATGEPAAQVQDKVTGQLAEAERIVREQLTTHQAAIQQHIGAALQLVDALLGRRAASP